MRVLRRYGRITKILFAAFAAVTTAALSGVIVLYLLTNLTQPRIPQNNTPESAESSDMGAVSPHISTGVDKGTIITLTNRYRESKNLSSLSENQQLYNSACAKADDMIARNYWSHDAPDGSKPWKFFNEVGYAYYRAGENLAYGFNSSEATVDGWIKSPTHEANLAGDYRELGVCVRGPVAYQGGTYHVIVAHYGSPH